MMTNFLHIALIIAMGFIMLAFIFVFIRIIIGPDTNNRIAALDLVASLVASIILVFSVVSHQQIYIDIPIIIALVSFIGTVALSIYIKNK